MPVGKKIEIIIDDAKDVVNLKDQVLHARDVIKSPEASKLDVVAACGRCGLSAALAFLRVMDRHRGQTPDTHTCVSCDTEHDILDMHYQRVSVRE